MTAPGGRPPRSRFFDPNLLFHPYLINFFVPRETLVLLRRLKSIFTIYRTNYKLFEISNNNLSKVTFVNSQASHTSVDLMKTKL
jgi:hypothetical protein